MTSHPIVRTARTALARGLRRRCPHCGEGELFERWFTLRDRCPTCGLQLELNPGDTWFLWLIGDRIFLAVLIVAVFLVFRSSSWSFALVLLVVTVVPLVWTMPHRMGVCVACDYLSRRWWGDHSELPPSGN
jgi:uncharacterized protein (DUF983 family)